MWIHLILQFIEFVLITILIDSQNKGNFVMPNFYFVFLLLFKHCLMKQIFIDYGVSKEGTLIMQYLMKTPEAEKFYVDIGAYDPIFASNTLNLHTSGWKGINVDASAHRMKNFYILRPDDVNVNYAVAQDKKLINLYQLADDSSSTTNKKISQLEADIKPLIEQIPIASISMKTLCQNYYIERPIFMNIDIQGTGSQALQSNDWNKPECRPEIILSQKNQLNEKSEYPLPEQVLRKHSYTKVNQVGMNQLFIADQARQKYQSIFEETSKKWDYKEVISFQQVISEITKITNRNSTWAPHYNIYWDQIYYHFSCQGQSIHTSSLLKKSQHFYEKQKKDIRPILILNFNPSSSIIIIDDATSYKKNKIGENFEFLNITVLGAQPYTLYIFNHKYSPPSQIKIYTFSHISDLNNTQKTILQLQGGDLANSGVSDMLQEIEKSLIDVKKVAEVTESQIQYVIRHMEQNTGRILNKQEGLKFKLLDQKGKNMEDIPKLNKKIENIQVSINSLQNIIFIFIGSIVILFLILCYYARTVFNSIYKMFNQLQNKKKPKKISISSSNLGQESEDEAEEYD